MLSYYEILQVTEDASDAEIKKAYRKLCKILHPDLHDNTREANVIFNLLHEAYETLSNPDKRRNYNPKQKKSNSFEVSHEKYDEILTGYKKIVKDYEKILKSKNAREKELLEEIRKLKKENYQSQSFKEHEVNQPKVEKNEADVKTDSSNQRSTLEIILLVVFWMVVIGIIILILTIPAGWWFIFALIGLPIYFFISAFRKL